MDSNTGQNRPKNKGQFRKGDPRINRKGRPKAFDALRKLAQSIAHEEAKRKDSVVIINGHKATVVEMILRQWAQSKNPKLQMAFVEIAFGKVPNNIDITSGGEKLPRASTAAEDAAKIVAIRDAILDEVAALKGVGDASK